MQTLQQGNQELGIVITMNTGIIATSLDSYKKAFRNVFPSYVHLTDVPNLTRNNFIAQKLEAP